MKEWTRPIVDISRWQSHGSPPEGGGVGPLCAECGVSRWIEIGGGPAKDVNHPNLDIAPGEGVDIVCDLERNSLPFHDGHATFVKAIHSLQHMSRDGARHVIEETYRILSSSGKFYIMLGDFDFIVDRLKEDGLYDGWMNCVFHGTGIDEAFGYHRWGYNFNSIKYHIIQKKHKYYDE